MKAFWDWKTARQSPGGGCIDPAGGEVGDGLPKSIKGLSGMGKPLECTHFGS